MKTAGMATAALAFSASLPKANSFNPSLKTGALAKVGQPLTASCRLSTQARPMFGTVTHSRPLTAMALSPQNEQRVADFLSEATQQEVTIADKDKNLAEAFDVDSLTAVEIGMGLEEEFNVEIGDDELPEITTMSAIFDLLDKKGVE